MDAIEMKGTLPIERSLEDTTPSREHRLCPRDLAESGEHRYGCIDRSTRCIIPPSPLIVRHYLVSDTAHTSTWETEAAANRLLVSELLPGIQLTRRNGGCIDTRGVRCALPYSTLPTAPHVIALGRIRIETVFARYRFFNLLTKSTECS